MDTIVSMALVALGALAGTIWWIFFILKIFLPKVKQLEDKYESEKANIIDVFESKLEEKIPDVEGKFDEKLKEFEDRLPKKAEGFLDTIMDPKNEKMQKKLATLGITLINPLLSCLQNPEDKQGRLILENIISNSWKTVESSPWFKQSFKQWIKQNSQYLITTVVEEASKNPEFIPELIKAYVSVQKEGGGGGRADMMKGIKEKGIWGLVELAKEGKDAGLF